VAHRRRPEAGSIGRSVHGEEKRQPGESKRSGQPSSYRCNNSGSDLYVTHRQCWIAKSGTKWRADQNPRGFTGRQPLQNLLNRRARDSRQRRRRLIGSCGCFPGPDERAQLHAPLPKSTIDTNHYARVTSACRPHNRKIESAISQCCHWRWACRLINRNIRKK
jgi:hypothetical protein